MLTGSIKISRGKALEEAFFFRMDQELIELLSRSIEKEEKMRSFAKATGIADRSRLESLVNAGFELSTLTAFLWVPVVFVAWADGHADGLEKQSILNILKSKGLPQQTANMMVSHEWFRNPPSEELWTIWEDFIGSTLATLNENLRNELTDEVVRLCHVVAEASGGFLGIGKTSAVEQRVIERVKKSLQRYSAAHMAMESSESLALRSA